VKVNKQVTVEFNASETETLSKIMEFTRSWLKVRAEFDGWTPKERSEVQTLVNIYFDLT
jgi:hypothetical protein